MALAEVSDVEAALGRDPSEVFDNVDVLLEQASDLVNGYLHWSVPDPVPAPVARVVADMVVAILTKPVVSTADYSAGGYNQYREAATVQIGVESPTTTGPWLTKALRMRLRPYRRGAWSIDTQAPPEPGS